MNITDNEYFKSFWENIERDLEGIHPGKLVTIKAYYETGIKITETIFTAQHDKEMEEFAEWATKYALKRGSGLWMHTKKNEIMQFDSLLQLFRNRNK